jgi:hypothetical protein
MSEQQGNININSAPSANQAKIGDKIFYLNGEYAGIIEADEGDRFILDIIIKDGSRNAYILKKNEDVEWSVKNELTLYPHPDSEGFIGVAIYDSFGGFPIYENCLRHDPKVIEEASKDKNVKIVYIPDYMIDFYTITEYHGWETCVLEVDKYKISEIEKITRSTKEILTKLKEIESVLDGDYPTEPL